MKEEIIILEELPVIFTKDKEWAKRMATRPYKRGGEIIVLPEDAVLVIPPTYYEIKKEKT